MEDKNQYQAELFSNRLKKKYKELKKWARKNRISSYRIYDRDIPEIPLCLDLYEFLPENINNKIELAKFLTEQNENLSANIPNYENEIKSRTYAVIYLYERPYQKDESEENKWFNLMAETAAKTLGIPNTNIIKKMRKHQKGKSQYEKTENQDEKQLKPSNFNGLIQEQGQLFKIDLSSYLDTGLFFDHRPLRKIVRESSSNKNVLNLFCYTGSFSVYAAEGKAKSVESVDLSNTYLTWAKENMEQNSFSDKEKYIFTRQDCIQFLKEKAIAQKDNLNNSEKKSDLAKKAKTYDLIILDPPTFSNSKNTSNILDINKQWPQLVKDCLNILNPNGILYFSTNSERLKFDKNLLPQKTIAGLNIYSEDITNTTIPKDFEQKLPHHCWKLWVN